MGASFGSLDLLVHLASEALTDAYLAREPAPAGARLITLSVLRHDAEPEAIARFVSEARIASRLVHPNLVAVAGFGRIEGLEAMAKEFVLGFSLEAAREAAIHAGRPLSEDILLRIAASVCRGLHFAHELTDEGGRPLGIVHRDLVPSNVLLAFNGEAKLTNFGLARSADRDWRTSAGKLTGNVHHMAPEQFVSAEVDRRADVFCLGILLWESLTGAQLFKGRSLGEVHRAVVSGPIEAPSRVAPDVSRPVDALVLKALERAPEARFQTAAELAEAIEDVFRSSGRAVDTSDVAVHVTQVLGERIPKLAMALRAAIAGRGDEAELARLVGGHVVTNGPVRPAPRAPARPAVAPPPPSGPEARAPARPAAPPPPPPPPLPVEDEEEEEDGGPAGQEDATILVRHLTRPMPSLAADLVADLAADVAAIRAADPGVLRGPDRDADQAAGHGDPGAHQGDPGARQGADISEPEAPPRRRPAILDDAPTVISALPAEFLAAHAQLPEAVEPDEDRWNKTMAQTISAMDLQWILEGQRDLPAPRKPSTPPAPAEPPVSPRVVRPRRTRGR